MTEVLGVALFLGLAGLPEVPGVRSVPIALLGRWYRRMGRGAALLLATLLVGVTAGPSVVGADPDPGASPPAVRRLAGPQADGEKVRERPEMDQGSLLVRFSSRSGTAAAALADHSLDRRRAVGPTGFVEVGTSGRPPDAVRKELARDPCVETMEPNYIRRATADPNDALFAQEPRRTSGSTGCRRRPGGGSGGGNAGCGRCRRAPIGSPPVGCAASLS